MRGSNKAVYVPLIALVIGLFVAGVYLKNRRDIKVAAVGNPTVGTTGHENAPDSEESPATLHDLETVTGSVDQHELIGRRVDFQVKVADTADSTSFWVGTKDNRILVVLGRDDRRDTQRDHRNASSNGIQPVKTGQMARITGIVEGVPKAEARFGGEVNDSVRRELKDQRVYIRAENVIPQG